MKIKAGILERANKKLRKMELEAKYQQKCEDAGICPICGADLDFRAGSSRITGNSWVLTICPKCDYQHF